MPYSVALMVPRGIRNNKDQEAKYIAACLEEIKQELRQYNLSVKVVTLCSSAESNLSESLLRQMQWPS